MSLKSKFSVQDAVRIPTPKPINVADAAGARDDLLSFSRTSFPQAEVDVVRLWRSLDAFRLGLKESEGRPPYSFYDGPPFATGSPHYGHLLAGGIKDVVCRFAHQNGKFVDRRFGWDTHGLPIEFEIEKSLGLKTKDDVEEFGLRNYNAECRAIVMRYSGVWQTVMERAGRWIDFERDYKTLSPSYMESVWWGFSTLWQKNLVFRGHKVMPYSTSCTTPLSNFEANMDYREVSDPSVLITFPIETVSEAATAAGFAPGFNLVAWTTTPWTLPSNLALCVNPNFDYVAVKEVSPVDEDARVFICEASRMSEIVNALAALNKSKAKGAASGKVDASKPDAAAAAVAAAAAPKSAPKPAGKAGPSRSKSKPADANDTPAPVVGEVDPSGTLEVVAVAKGSVLFGATYTPLFPYFDDLKNGPATGVGGAYRVVTDNYVTRGTGTGVVHQSPASGEDDCRVCLSHGIIDKRELGRVCPLDANGRFLNVITEFAGQYIKDADDGICRALKDRKRLLWKGAVVHSYPFCWRSGQPLIYRAVGSWFVDVPAIKPQVKAALDDTTWVPPFVHKRFINSIDEAPDWSVSRTRYWGTPLPIWTNFESDLCFVPSSVAALEAAGYVLAGAAAGEDTVLGTYTDAQVAAAKAAVERLRAETPAANLSTVGDVLRAVLEVPTPTGGVDVEVSVLKLADGAVNDLHRENVDIILADAKAVPTTLPGGAAVPADSLLVSPSGGLRLLARVPDVFDCWFESGSMPHAQVHYPFENQELFHDRFPAQFIAEGIDQTRGWFYTMLVLSTALFGKCSYQNVVVNGLVLAADGKKMSKSLKNYPDPAEILGNHGADALRLFLITSPVVRGDSVPFKQEFVREVVRDVLKPLWNAYILFALNYNDAHAFLNGGTRKYTDRIIDDTPAFDIVNLWSTTTNTMDSWMLSLRESLLRDVTDQMEKYHLYAVLPKVLSFRENLTNWFLRMNRPRFRAAAAPDADDATREDGRVALSVVFNVLLTTVVVFSPYAPFISERIYQSLRTLLPDGHPLKCESVHFVLLKDLAFGASAFNVDVERRMARLQAIVSLARTARDAAPRINLRRPVREVLIVSDAAHFAEDFDAIKEYLKSELNAAEVVAAPTGNLVTLAAAKVPAVLGPKTRTWDKDQRAAFDKALAAVPDAELKAAAAAVAAHAEANRGGAAVDELNDDPEARGRGAAAAVVVPGSVLSVGGIDVAVGVDITVRCEVNRAALQARAGESGIEHVYADASDGTFVVVVDKASDPALLAAWVGREFVSSLQQLRKQEGFSQADALDVHWRVKGASAEGNPEEVSKALREESEKMATTLRGKVVESETSVAPILPEGAAATGVVDVLGVEMEVALVRV